MAGLRKRNKTTQNSPAESSVDTTQKQKDHIPSDDDMDKPESKSKYSGMLYTLTLIVLGAAVYLYPEPFQQALEFWIGSSEWEQPVVAAPTAMGNEPISRFRADIPKRNAVVQAFKHAWDSYESYAMGSDEYHPISQGGSNLTKAGGIGYTVIDAIDTLLIMGLDDEYDRARKWVETDLTFDRDAEFSTFETTIRVLGGLLSTYHLSKHDPLFLERAVDLADRILTAFDTPSGLPLSLVNLATRTGANPNDYPGLISTAEAATLQLEFRYLSELTGNDIYWTTVEKVMSVIKDARLPHGLASIFLTVKEGNFIPSAIRLGSRADSYYEYLLKQYLQTNNTEMVYKNMYEDSMTAVHSFLVQESTSTKAIYTSELIPEELPDGELSWRLTPKQEHLVCFIGGSLMLGATTSGVLEHGKKVSIPPLREELSENGWRDWNTGIQLIKTCVDTHDTATGLAPEVVHFRIPNDGLDSSMLDTPHDWYIKGGKQGDLPSYDARYMLRPETVESLFLAYRLTADVRYRTWGWQIFQAIEKHCRVSSGGYATVINVDEVPVRLENKMESFFLSETLKYLFLLFSDETVLPLDEVVFNTEAHPLPIFNPTFATGFS